MSEISWIKLSVDIFEDDKVRIVQKMYGPSAVLIWIKMLCIAGKCNTGGSLMISSKKNHTTDTLSFILDVDEDELEGLLDLYEELEMIYRENDVIYITNWEKWQSIEKMELIKEQTRQRVANYRERNRCNVTSNANVTQDVTQDVTQCNADVTVNVTQCNAIDKDKELDIDTNTINSISERNLKTYRFIPPTLSEISTYIDEKGYWYVNPERFYNYYESVGWTIGKGKKMKNWHSAVASWQAREKEQKEIF